MHTFKVIVNATNNTAKRLKIDLKIRWELYERFIFRYFGWLRCAENVVDGLTKPELFPAFESLMIVGKIFIRISEWVEGIAFCPLQVASEKQRGSLNNSLSSPQ